ncbi:MAG TPA: dihydrolipoyl dehydrogenase, partial [Actinomycetota bacterium]|nr:dihydrolipoyl dehydrogenase [Actinomycetota bacterium]
MPRQAQDQVFDLVVVGGGPGGYPAAIRAAQLGLRTALVEKERPGGVCLNWGCIPTKAMLRSAEVLETARHGAEYGVLADNVRLDYAAVLARKDRVVKSLTDGVAGLLAASGVTVTIGHARLTGPGSVAVVGVGEAPLGPGGPRYNAPAAGDGAPVATLEARNLLLATGSTPALLPVPGIDLPGVVSSDGAFLLEEVPRRIVIVGASAVGAEWATMFQAFGSEVTMVELLPRLLPAEDEDIGKALARSFARRGIKVETGRTVTGIAPAGDRAPPLLVTVADPDGSNPRQVEADVVLVGVGRRPNTAGLDLEKAGVATDGRGWVEVDDRLRTSAPGVHAVGDVTGRVLLAHVASHQGLVAAGVMAGHDERMDYRAVPAATFTHPEVASVGLTEAAARESGHDVAVGRFPFSALGRAQTFGGVEGLVKVVAERSSGQVLGVHVIGPGASDLIPEGVLAMQLRATLADIAATIHAHPTLGEGTMEAALVALGLPVHLPPFRRPAADSGDRPAVESRKRPRSGAVDSPGRSTPGSATLPHRGAEPGAGPLKAAPGTRPTAAPAPAHGPGPEPTPALTPAGPRAPRFDLTVRVDVTRLLEFQAELNRQLGATGTQVGLTDLVVKSCAGLLAASPELNASFGGDRLLVHKRVHVGVAVDGAALVPAVRDADRKRVARIAEEVAALSERARAGRLGPEEAGRAAFTVSSLGVDQFTAVLEPSEGAVLAVGAAQPEPRVVDGRVEVRRVLRLTLSIDHRVVDGATGGRFLARLRDALERPLGIVA